MLDVIKGFAGKSWFGLLAWLMPSFLAIVAFWLFVLPIAAPADWSLAQRFRDLGFGQIATLIGWSLIIGIASKALSTPLYRILEGYSWPRSVRNFGVRRQTKIFLRLSAVVNGDIPGQRWERGLALEKLARFPKDPAQIAPTRFGNALRAFETYGKNRFNLDSQILWVELCAVVPEDLKTEQELARAYVDLFVAACSLSIAFSLTCFVLVLNQGHASLSDWLPILLPLLVAHCSYRMAIVACDYWASTVQAIVNLGRVPLAKAFGLRLPKTLADERRMWGALVSYVFYGERNGNSGKLDGFRNPKAGETDVT